MIRRLLLSALLGTFALFAQASAHNATVESRPAPKGAQRPSERLASLATAEKAETLFQRAEKAEERYRAGGDNAYHRSALGDYALSAELGHAQSKYEWGMALSTGIFVPKDQKRALKLWKEAADAGNADAMNSLGVAYAMGDGVEADPAIAWMFYADAARSGNGFAARALRQKSEAAPSMLVRATTVMRVLPNADSAVAAELAAGTRVFLVKQLKDDWTAVYLETQTRVGFVPSATIERIQ